MRNLEQPSMSELKKGQWKSFGRVTMQTSMKPIGRKGANTRGFKQAISRSESRRIWRDKQRATK